MLDGTEIKKSDRIKAIQVIFNYSTFAELVSDPETSCTILDGIVLDFDSVW